MYVIYVAMLLKLNEVAVEVMIVQVYMFPT